MSLFGEFCVYVTRTLTSPFSNNISCYLLISKFLFILCRMWRLIWGVEQLENHFSIIKNLLKVRILIFTLLKCSPCMKPQGVAQITRTASHKVKVTNSDLLYSWNGAELIKKMVHLVCGELQKNSMVNYWSIGITIYINDLDFPKAYILESQHVGVHIKSLWDVLFFWSSKFWFLGESLTSDLYFMKCGP